MGLESCCHGSSKSKVEHMTIANKQWKPEGEQSYSQSVVDLFEFITQSLHVILVSLPLTPYKRSLYLADMSKVN